MLGIDIGSGGCKVTIVDNSGEFAATAFKEYPTDYPIPAGPNSILINGIRLCSRF